MTWLTEFVDIAHAQIGERVREALWTRGVSDEQIDLFSLGHMSGQLPDLDYPQAFVEWCWEGRRLQDSFVLPLTNSLGRVKGLQFRRVDPEKKGYSDYTPFTDEPVTFGLAQAMPHAWRTQAIWMVEGAFDVFPIQRVYPSVIPALTNKLSDPMARLLRRVVDDIWLAFDMDIKGREAAKRTLYTYRDDRFEIHDVRFPRPKTLDGKDHVKDPSELWEVWGDNRFKRFLRNLMENENAQGFQFG
jgi:DNA primase